MVTSITLRVELHTKQMRASPLLLISALSLLAQHVLGKRESTPKNRKVDAGEDRSLSTAGLCCELVVDALKDVLEQPSIAVSVSGSTLSPRWWYSRCPWYYHLLGWSCEDTKNSALRSLDEYCASQHPEQSIGEFNEIPPEVEEWLETVNNPTSGLSDGESAVSHKSFESAATYVFSPLARFIAAASEEDSSPPRTCGAEETPAVCSVYPAFVENTPTGVDQIRAAQTTLAVVIASAVRDTLGGATFSLRKLVVYETYRRLSGNGAGVYFSDTTWGPVSDLGVHILDLAKRASCSGDSNCKYNVGRREEARVGAFRTINALEVIILYSCIDPSRVCMPGFLPAGGFPSGSELPSMWATMYRYGVIELGEALWMPADGGGAACGINKKFVPNAASDTSY